MRYDIALGYVTERLDDGVAGRDELILKLARAVSPSDVQAVAASLLSGGMGVFSSFDPAKYHEQRLEMAYALVTRAAALRATVHAMEVLTRPSDVQSEKMAKLRLQAHAAVGGIAYAISVAVDPDDIERAAQALGVGV